MWQNKCFLIKLTITFNKRKKNISVLVGVASSFSSKIIIELRKKSFRHKENHYKSDLFKYHTSDCSKVLRLIGFITLRYLNWIHLLFLKSNCWQYYAEGILITTSCISHRSLLIFCNYDLFSILLKLRNQWRVLLKDRSFWNIIVIKENIEMVERSWFENKRLSIQQAAALGFPRKF